MTKEEEPITTFMWCGTVVKVYRQTVKFAGTTIQRHLLPSNLRRAVDQQVTCDLRNQVAGAANHQEASPHRIQQTQRRVRDAESAHYGVSARAVQRKQR